MRLPYALLVGLFLFSGAADPVSARSLLFAVPAKERPSDAVSMVADNKVEPATPGAGVPGSGDGSRGWLGARLQGVTQDIANGLGMKVPAGVVVAVLVPGGPAERAGLRRGDVILKIDGEDVARMQSFVERIGRTAPGKTVSLLLFRRGVQQSLTVEIGSPPGAAGQSAQDLPGRADDIGLNALLGISVERLSDEARSGHGIGEHIWGVAITQVQPTQKLLKAREVVVEVDQQAVTTPDQLVRRVNAVRRTGRRSVLLTIATAQGDTRYAAIPFSAGTQAPAAASEQRRQSAGDALKELPELERLETLK